LRKQATPDDGILFFLSETAQIQVSSWKGTFGQKATDSIKACRQQRSAVRVRIRRTSFGLQRGLHTAFKLMLALGCLQTVCGADPNARPGSTDGWHNRQRFKWVTKEPESGAAVDGDEDVHWFLWSVLGVASVGVGLVTVMTLRRWDRADERKAAMTESVMAEDPSMVEFLRALHEGPVVGESETSILWNAGPGPAKTGESVAVSDTRPKDLAGSVKDLSDLWAAFMKSGRFPGDEDQPKKLHELMQIAAQIQEGCAVSHLRPARLLASALKGLLRQLSTRASNLTPSALRTGAAAIDLLELLCDRSVRPDLLSEPPVRILVVDDDPITRGTLSSGLRKALTEPELAPDGKTALILVAQRSYDLILLDVEMPGLDGFEVCSKIHDTVKNCTTPVVFVTSHSDFDSRAKSALVGAHDLIGKPFLAFEITVKALTLVLRTRLGDEKPARNETEKPNSGTTPGLEGTASAALPSSPVAATASEQLSRKLNEIGTPSKPQLDAVATVLNSGSAPAVTASKSQPPRAEPGHPAGDPQPSTCEYARAFLERAPAQIQLLRTQLAAARDSTQPAEREELLRKLLLGVRTLCAEADRAKLSALLRIGSALEAVVKRLEKQPRYDITAAALDMIDQLCQSGADLDLAKAPAHLLVVDDDPVARRAIAGSLQLAFGRPDSADCGDAALVLATDTLYDLIFVDVLMPGMDGYATCEKLHELPLNLLSPVVFVTSLDDMDSRTKAAISGGCGFIPKPVVPCEIMLVALTYIVRSRLQARALATWKDAISAPANEGVLVGGLN
jgi:CheY-like chemotaxis protein